MRRVVADTIRSHVESVKRFVTLELSLVGLIVQTLLFAHVWFQWYYPLISSFRFSQEGFAFGTGLKLYFRGHLLILAVYLVVLLFLSKIMGALKTGYLKPANIFASVRYRFQIRFTAVPLLEDRDWGGLRYIARDSSRP